MMLIDEAKRIAWPSAPRGGGVLVLSPAVINNLDALCVLKTIYPQTRLIANEPIPTQ